MPYIENEDKVIYDVIQRKFQRQNSNIEPITSENFVPQAVMETQSSILANKHAEDCPERRYYEGHERVDVIGSIAIERAKALSGTEHVSAQPHSGSRVNTAVYLATLEMGDTVLGMNLGHGGHLTYGVTASFSDKFHHFAEYGMDQENELIDYDEVRRLAIEHQPKLTVTGASAYLRTIDFKKFKEIADEIGAKLMVDVAYIAGLIAAGLHPNPVEYADFVTTTTHKTLRGPRDGMILCKEEYKKDIDKTILPGIQGGPLEHAIAAKAIVFRGVPNDDFKDYQNQVIKNTQALAQTLIEGGFRVVSGGTDNRLVAADIKDSTNMTDKLAEEILDKVGITYNKNTIPLDKEKPLVVSDIRLGTLAAATRGFDESASMEVAKITSSTLNNYDDDTKPNEAKERVHVLTSKYPLCN